MIDTGHTLTLAARTLHEKGAKTIYVLISHGACYVGCNGQASDDP